MDLDNKKFCLPLEVLENLRIALLIMDQNRKILFVNKMVKKMTLYSQEELIGKGIQETLFALFHPECSMEKLFSSDQCEFNALLRRKDGSEFFAHCIGQVLKVEEDFFIIFTFIDITKRKLLEQKLFIAANTDALTGLYNRRFIYEAFKQTKAISDRYQVPFSVIFLDLDYFKLINDLYGHDTGDRILIEVAKVLKKNLRKSDLAGRWGGEEFLILLPHTNLSSALRVAEKIREEIKNLKVPPVEGITASFGVAEYKEGESVEEIIKRADLALYKAKDEGRNCIISF